MKVQFNAVEEFLAELRADVDLIDRKVVRVTKTFRMLPHGAQEIAIVATAVIGGEKIVLNGKGFEPPVFIVRLDRFIGNVFFPREPVEEDKKVVERASQIAGEIENELQKMGMTVRAGVYSE